MGSARYAVARLVALPVECAHPPHDAPPRPRAVVVERRGRRLLVDADAAAQRAGVTAGQTETEAKARCPDLDVRSRAEARERLRLETAAEALMAFGPEVEIQPPSFLALEIGRSRGALAGRFEGRVPDDATLGAALRDRLAHLDHRAVVAIADDADTARTLTAVRMGPDFEPAVDVIEPGQSPAALAPLPVAALAWTDARSDPEGRLEAKLSEAAATLETLGLSRVRDLLALEGHPLPARLEEAGPMLGRRARGEMQRPLQAHQPSERIVETFELDRGTDDIEPLLFVLRRLVNGVCARLDGRAESTASIRLRWVYEPGLDHAIDDRALRPRSSRRTEHVDVELARPTRDAATLFSVLREQVRVPGFVRHVGLEATAAAPDHGCQLDLFSRYPQKVEEAAALVSRLQARLGREAVFSPRIVDVHRPEAAWRPVPFDLDRALAEAHPPAARKPTVELAPLPWSDRGRDERVLPRVDAQLSVTGASSGDGVRTLDAESARTSWPKPVPRRPDDEPPPPLPPRPTHLLDRPERVRWLRDAHGDALEVRGETVRIVRWCGFERFETEWWSPTPMQRDYRVACTEDGRELWLFQTPDGVTHLHGWFD